MNLEDRSKIQSFIGDIEGLKSQTSDGSKFKDWKEKVGKKLDEVFGKNSDQLTRFNRVRFFDFTRSGKPEKTPLSENERREYIQRLDEAKRLLQHFI